MAPLTKLDEILCSCIQELQNEQGKCSISLVRARYKKITGKDWDKDQNWMTLTKYFTGNSAIYVFHKSRIPGKHEVSLNPEFLSDRPEYGLKKQGESKEDEEKRISLERKKVLAEEKKKKEERRRMEMENEERAARRRAEQFKKDAEQLRQKKEFQAQEKKRIASLSVDDQEKISRMEKKIQSIEKPNNKNSGVRKYEESYEVIDQHARSAPQTLTSGKDIVAYIGKVAKNDEQKCRAFYVWITANLKHSKSRKGSSDPVEVLKTKETRAYGFSSVFKLFCDLSNILCVTVWGKFKGLEHITGDPEFYSHCWNVVLVDDSWQLVDCTWGTVHMTGDQHVYEFMDRFFFCDPKYFIQDHFPKDDSKWQLLDTPISNDQFEVMAYISPSGIDCGLEPISHTESLINVTKSNVIELKFRCHSKNYWFASLEYFDSKKSGKRIEDCIFMERLSETELNLHVIFPYVGEKYHLRLFCNKTSPVGNFSQALKYVCQVSENAKQDLDANGFPISKTTELHRSCGLQLVSHRYKMILLDDINMTTFTMKLNQSAQWQATIQPVIDDEPGEAFPSHEVVNTFRDGEMCSTQCIFRDFGEYVVKIFLKLPSDELFTLGFSYSVFVADETKLKYHSFPETRYAEFRKYHGKLLEPITNPVPFGQVVSFKIYIEEATDALLLINKTRFPLARLENNIWGSPIEITEKGDLKIFAKFGSDLKCVVKYTTEIEV